MAYEFSLKQKSTAKLFSSIVREAIVDGPSTCPVREEASGMGTRKSRLSWGGSVSNYSEIRI